jgi:hypothetical protein
MNFKQFDNEHVAQAWERMKSLIKNYPTHGLTTWMIIQIFYAGLDFSSRNLLDSAAAGTFMSITLGAATNSFITFFLDSLFQKLKSVSIQKRLKHLLPHSLLRWYVFVMLILIYIDMLNSSSHAL